MRYFLICDEEDTLTGLRLAGIEGVLVKSKQELDVEFEKAIEDTGIAVLLLSENCAAMDSERINKIKLSAKRPLVAVIPGSTGYKGEAGSITDLIRDAIGIKI